MNYCQKTGDAGYDQLRAHLIYLANVREQAKRDGNPLATALDPQVMNVGAAAILKQMPEPEVPPIEDGDRFDEAFLGQQRI